jgi:hypothetical protein
MVQEGYGRFEVKKGGGRPRGIYPRAHPDNTPPRSSEPGYFLRVVAFFAAGFFAAVAFFAGAAFLAAGFLAAGFFVVAISRASLPCPGSISPGGVNRGCPGQGPGDSRTALRLCGRKRHAVRTSKHSRRKKLFKSTVP